VRALFDNPALLLIGFGVPLLLGVVVLLAVYGVVRLAVRHGALDADRARRGPAGTAGHDSAGG
jgi:hypothetical protein